MFNALTHILVAVGAVLLILLPLAAHAEPESCSKFTFATSKSELAKLPITVVRTGISPVLGIAGVAYYLDTATHCLKKVGDDSKACTSTPVLSNGKVVARIEGSPMPTIFSTDSRGQIDRTQPHYRMMVERDAYRSTQPRFWVEAVSPDAQVLGRIDAVDGLTIQQMNSKGTRLQKIAAGHGLIDMRGTSLLYSNCRKLAKMKFKNEYYSPRGEREIASSDSANGSKGRPLGQIPRTMFVRK